MKVHLRHPELKYLCLHFQSEGSPDDRQEEGDNEQHRMPPILSSRLSKHCKSPLDEGGKHPREEPEREIDGDQGAHGDVEECPVLHCRPPPVLPLGEDADERADEVQRV